MPNRGDIRIMKHYDVQRGWFRLVPKVSIIYVVEEYGSTKYGYDTWHYRYESDSIDGAMWAADALSNGSEPGHIARDIGYDML